MKRKILLINLIAVMLVAVGVCLISSAYADQKVLFVEEVTSSEVVASVQNLEGKDRISGIPVKLELPSIGKIFEIKEGEYDDNTRTWTLSKDSVYFANLSAPANNVSGTTLIYGHNRKNLFGVLFKLQAGDKAIVSTDNGHVFHYTLSEVADVSPDDTKLAIDKDGNPRLVLQTCIGLFWEKRQLFIFNLENVE